MSQGHYFDVDPAVPSRPGQIELSLPDFHASLTVDRGVFAAGGVDPGTCELLKATPAPPGVGDLLDLGCGYGPIACTLAHRSPGATVWAVDVNERALALTARNAAALHLGGVHPARPDAVPASVCFAGIWSNPPVRIGKAALHGLLTEWLPRLASDGAAWLVVHRHLGADSLAAWLGGEGWGVTRLASKRGYRILRVMRP
jgi:16S rRNA (guanine1207-N2)-methyltransferase